jgi:drug/metabolite transporter, DME family
LNPLGVITGLVSGLLFAGYNMLGKQAATLRMNSWTSLLYSFAFGSIFALIFNVIAMLLNAEPLAALVPSLPVNGWLVLIVLSFVPTLLGFGLYNTSMNYLPASTASLIATSEPAITAVLAYIFLNERMTIVQIVGSLIILSAVVIVTFEKEETNRGDP